MWSIDTMEYYSDVKENKQSNKQTETKTMNFAGKGMKLEKALLNEITQTHLESSSL